MYIEVDVQENDNCDFPLNRMFSALGDPARIVRIDCPGPRGDTAMYDVTGWSEAGPCPAYGVRVEDSGEGVALLVYGGDLGIRLRPNNSPEPWSIDLSDQWGEPCLLLDADAEAEYADSVA